MRGADLRALSPDQLVSRFAEFAVAQDDAQLDGNMRISNDISDMLEAIFAELERRGLLASLQILLNDRRKPVRLAAARRLMRVPEMRAAARPVLWTIAASPVRSRHAVHATDTLEHVDGPDWQLKR